MLSILRKLQRVKVSNIRPLALSVIAIIASTFVVTIALITSSIEAPLLPAEQSTHPWQALFTSDNYEGSNTRITSRDSRYTLNFDFNLDKSNNPFPFAMATLQMGEGNSPNTALFDGSQYSSVKLTLKCQPYNVLNFALHSYDSEYSTLGDIESYRISTHFLTCRKQWQSVIIDLKRLKTPEWWLEHRGLPYSSQYYDLSRIKSFSVTSSNQSPAAQDSNISISEFTLIGQNNTYLYASVGIVALFWLGFIFWLMHQHTQQLANKLRTELKHDASSKLEPQSVHFQSRQDKEKYDVLRFLAHEYTNPDLSMDVLVNTLGINRDKINNILKQETELTFSTYLNQLRLQEAARLLETKKASVTEIAYAVGYKSVNYFNRLFKRAYNLTPKAYRGQNSND